MNAAFTARWEDGREVRPTAEQIATRLVDAFVAMGKDTLGPRIVGEESLGAERDKLGLLLDEALDLEAGLVRGEHTGGTVSPADRALYIQQKITMAADKAGLLAAVSGQVHSEVNPDTFQLVCAHPVYRGESGLGQIITEGAKSKGFDRVNHAWDDAKAVFFYQARLGFPVYWVTPVNGRMKEAYDEVQAGPVRDRRYPLHIDAAWEHALPDLDPVRRQQQAAEKARADRHILFALLRAEGGISEGESGWALTLPERDPVPLAANMEAAIDALSDHLSAHQANAAQSFVADQRAWLEGPKEPPEDWAKLGTHLQEVAKRAFNLPAEHPLHAHWTELSGWFRDFAPKPALDAKRSDLAPAKDTPA